ncbi:MAG: hypothetical protein N3G20_01110 [Verrucomicrobiae bacterium]|nr:hypothetical protein [Verrucomicrobiae bacterium]
MSKWSKGIALLVTVVCGLALVSILLRSDERRIISLLDEMVREINSQKKGSYLANLATANRIADFFDTDFEIQIEAAGTPELHITERSELIQVLLRAKNWSQKIRVELLDPRFLEVTSVGAVVDATGKAQVSGQDDIFVSELRFSLVKTDGRWRIRKVQTVPTFQ